MIYEEPIAFRVGFANTETDEPAEWYPATVPGAVQLDYARAKGLPPYYFGTHVRDYAFAEHVWWRYRAEIGNEYLGKKVFFDCGGIDYDYKILLNGAVIDAYEGLYRRVFLDLTDRLTGHDTLEVVIAPPPHDDARPDDRAQAYKVCKPAVSWGWDWHPRLIPLGIWQKAELVAADEPLLIDSRLAYQLDAERTSADFTVFLHGTEPQFSYRVEIASPEGDCVFAADGTSESPDAAVQGRLSPVALWYPRGYGAQSLYRVTVTVGNSQKTYRVGFRTTELRVYEGGWWERYKLPMSRNNPPITLHINGQRVYCKGTNWLPPEIFYGTIRDEQYRTLLTLAAEANFNTLRCWGGGIVNDDRFFDICDELGLLVWQEFPLACNEYPDDPHYLQVLNRESRAIIDRVSRHASLCLWCGGNELFNAWSRMTDQSLALRLLNRNTLEMTPKIPFLSTSPMSGMAHGGYTFRDAWGREVYEVFQNAENTAYTEFGCPSISSKNVLALAIPPEEMTLPTREMESWYVHHAYDAWQPDTWLCEETLEYYFGKPESLDDLIAQSQLLQCEGYKAIYEEGRRQQPRCAMVLNWCFNEPWPCAAGNNIVAYDLTVKPAYYAVRDALRPALASARVKKFVWTEGELFTAEIWGLNDGVKEAELGRITAVLELAGEETELAAWECGALPPQTNRQGPTVAFRLPAAKRGLFRLKLRAENEAFNSEYTMQYRPAERRWGRRGMNQ